MSGLISLAGIGAQFGSGDPTEIITGTRESGPRGIESTIEYNGLSLNNRNNVDTYLVTHISGLDDADVRDSREVNPNDHGETPFAAHYAGRTIVLQGKIIAHTIWKLRDMEMALRTAFADIRNEYPLTFRTNDVNTDLFIKCKKIGKIEMPDEQKHANHFERQFQITLRASNPRFTAYYEKSATLYRLANMVNIPSSEVSDIFGSHSGSSAGQPAATRVRTSDWAAVGSWSTRYTATRDDGSAVSVRTEGNAGQGNGAGRWPVTPGNWIAVRAKCRIRSTCGPLTGAWMAVVWWQPDAVTISAVDSQDAGLVTGPVGGGPVTEHDLVIIAQVPSDATWMSARPTFDPSSGVVAVDVDLDALAIYDLGPSSEGIIGAEGSTDPADVPAYFDGSMANAVWSGTPYASPSYRWAFEDDIHSFSAKVFNKGNFEAQPRIRFYGPISASAPNTQAIALTNDANGEDLILKSPTSSAVVVPSGNYIEIDSAENQMAEYTSSDALVGLAFNRLAVGSDEFLIEKGENVITPSVVPTGAGAPRIVITFRDTVI